MTKFLGRTAVHLGSRNGKHSDATATGQLGRGKAERSKTRKRKREIRDVARRK